MSPIYSSFDVFILIVVSPENKKPKSITIIKTKAIIPPNIRIVLSVTIYPL